MTRVVAVARRAWLLPVLAIVFFAVGIPRWLVGAPAAPNPDATFAKVCRDHGGKPVTTRTSAGPPPVQRQCVVRYGGTEYVMDAVTPQGWDGGAAQLQRDGCEESAGRAAATAHRTSFVYHTDTGVCERSE